MRQAEPVSLRGRLYRPALSAVTGESRRILIVDDHAEHRETLGALLTFSGHFVRTAADADEALEIAANFQPEVIFVDIDMPRADGYELCSRLRLSDTTAAAQIYALSGYGAEQRLKRSQEVGFDAHLVRPVDPEVLPRLI